MGFTSLTQFLAKNIQDALFGANGPSASNPFATVDELGAGVAKCSWQWSAALNQTVGSGLFFRSNDVYMNLTPFVIPVGSQLKMISVASENDDNDDTWIAEVIKNGDEVTPAYSLAVTGNKEFANGLSVAFVAGDEVTLKITSPDGNGIRRPRVTVFFKEV